MKRLLLLAAVLAFIPADASADTVDVLFGDGNWYPFEQPTTTGGAAFWNNSSFDGTNHACNIGFWLKGVGGCDANSGTFYNSSPNPSVEPPFLGDETTRFAMRKDAATTSVTVTSQLQVTQWIGADVFGWYLVANPAVMQPLFGGSLPSIGTQTFFPAGDYGFFLTSQHGTFLSTDSPGTNAHFAVYRLAGDGHYMVGAEDMWVGADNDYNDLVFEIQSNSVPEPMSILMVGAGLAGVIGLRRRRLPTAR